MIYDAIAPGVGIWAAILEKAWAKITGNYDRTDGGATWEGISLLTGAPYTDYQMSDPAVNYSGPNAWNIIY